MSKSRIVRTPIQLGAALRLRRRELGLSQGGVGARIDARQATVSNLENGASDTKLSTLMEVLAALDLELVVRPREATSRPSLEDLF
jgi:HTH-type transcriptional regulator/antitoxin HipB